MHDIWDAERYEHLARMLEEARFDAAFFADGMGLPDTVLRKLYYANALRLVPALSHAGFTD